MLKRGFQLAALLVASPAAALCGFGRWEQVYLFFAQLFALLPGVPGQFCRAAFYRLTLENTSQDIVIAFGSYFSNPKARVARQVSIGSYCVIGRAQIGPRTQIASHVQIPSGRRQHARGADGRLEGHAAARVVIGPDCWIGASAVVLADLGASVTVGAGSIVIQPLPDGVVAAGNPARILRPAPQAGGASHSD